MRPSSKILLEGRIQEAVPFFAKPFQIIYFPLTHTVESGRCQVRTSAVYIYRNPGGESGALASDMIRFYSSTKRTARCTFIWARVTRTFLSCPSFSPHPADPGIRCFPCIFSHSPVHPLHVPSRIHSVELPGVMV